MELIAVLCAAVALVAVAVVMHDPEPGRARRALAAAPALASDTADGSFVRATGAVHVIEHGERYISPLTETRCVAMRVRVVGRRHRQSAGGDIRETLKIRPFILDRGTAGKIFVDASHVRFAGQPAKLPRFGFTRQVEWLRELGLDSASAARSQFEEIVVEVGAIVSVAGTLQLRSSAPGRSEQSYRADTRELWLVGDEDHPVIIG